MGGARQFPGGTNYSRSLGKSKAQVPGYFVIIIVIIICLFFFNLFLAQSLVKKNPID